MRRIFRTSIRFLASVKQSQIKKHIPSGVFNTLKVYNYHLWLGYTIFTQDCGNNPIQVFRFLLKKRKQVLFYPDVPWESSMLYQICLILRWRISNNTARTFDLAVKWKPTTHSKPDAKLVELANHHRIINICCNDISKSHVDLEFRKIFGYGISIDPLTFDGRCVQKSDMNATHDGQIMDCPLEKVEDGRVYQLLIDNETDDGNVMDMRVPVIGGVIPVVFLYFRPIGIRFSAAIEQIKTAEVSEVFSEEEKDNILRFCASMGIDYAELDLLRNRKDGKIYIVDVNPTPHGPPAHIGTRQEGMKRLARTFADRFTAGV